MAQIVEDWIIRVLLYVLSTNFYVPCLYAFLYMCCYKIIGFRYGRILEESIDDAGAMIVTRYLSSFRALNKSFDFYLLQV